MASTIIIGDGPAGLSAALFLAKNGHPVTVFGGDQTDLHYAELHNYLGIPEIDGSAFAAIARQQVTGFGATLVDAAVTAVTAADGRFTVATEATEAAATADYLVIAGGMRARKLAESLGLEAGRAGVATDRDGRTEVDHVYAVGRVAKPTRSQAIISAGAGAAAALDILAREAGKDVTDWDSPPKDPA